MANVRTTLSVAPKINDWYLQKAEEMGIAKNALFVMALDAYMQQSTMIDLFNNPTFKAAMAEETQARSAQPLSPTMSKVKEINDIFGRD